MYSRQTMGGGGMGGGLTAPVPRDIWILLGVVFATFTLRHFAGTTWLPAILELSPAVWERGFVWQLVTYAFVGGGRSGLWLVITLLILYMFAGDVRRRLGRKGFWQLLVIAVFVGGVIGALTQLVMNLTTGAGLAPLSILQGERMLVAILIAAFATLAGDAIILLFFVLPIRAGWFLGLELLFAFLAFLSTRDLAGMLGVWGAVGFTWIVLKGGLKGGGMRELWLRTQERWFRFRLRQARRHRGFEVLPGGKDKDDDWLH